MSRRAIGRWTDREMREAVGKSRREALRDALVLGASVSREGTISLYRFEQAIERLLAETKGGSGEQG